MEQLFWTHSISKEPTSYSWTGRKIVGMNLLRTVYFIFIFFEHLVVSMLLIIHIFKLSFQSIEQLMKMSLMESEKDWLVVKFRPFY